MLGPHENSLHSTARVAGDHSASGPRKSPVALQQLPGWGKPCRGPWAPPPRTLQGRTLRSARPSCSGHCHTSTVCGPLLSPPLHLPSPGLAPPVQVGGQRDVSKLEPRPLLCGLKSFSTFASPMPLCPRSESSGFRARCLSVSLWGFYTRCLLSRKALRLHLLANPDSSFKSRKARLHSRPPTYQLCHLARTASTSWDGHED